MRILLHGTAIASIMVLKVVVMVVMVVVVVWNGEAKSVTVAAPKPPRYTTSLLLLSHVITCSLSLEQLYNLVLPLFPSTSILVSLSLSVELLLVLILNLSR